MLMYLLRNQNLTKAMSNAKVLLNMVSASPGSQRSKSSLEDCFAKIKSLVVIAKNPCLHPGDVRIPEAVDVPGLQHLYDCLVFPQNLRGDWHI